MDLAISIDGIDSARSGFVYLISQQGEGFFLEPNHGPCSGGTKVYVKGITSGPLQEGVPNALCRFGSHIFHAYEVDRNGEYIVCISPAYSLNNFSSSVEVDVSVAGQSSVFTKVGVLFYYDNEFSVSSIEPQSGPVDGGTRVIVKGGPFGPLRNPDELVCRSRKVLQLL